MQDYRKLKVWKKAHELALAVYEDTRCFPREELYGLTSQMRRAAVSISANIAEGAGRSGNGEFGRFLYIAMGSAAELECELALARDLHLLAPERHGRLASHVSEEKRMLGALIERVQAARTVNRKPSTVN